VPAEKSGAAVQAIGGDQDENRGIGTDQGIGDQVVIITTVKSAEVIRKLGADGWRLECIKGSHHQFAHPDKAGIVTVPHPRKDIPLPTLRSIYRQAGWPWR